MNTLELRLPPIVLVLLCAGLIVVIAQVSPSVMVAWPFRISFALLVFGVSVVMVVLSFLAFKHAKTTLNPMTPERSSTLITHGIFAYSRNPIYVAMLLWLVSFALLLASVFALLSCGLFWAYMTKFQIKPEEKALEAHFGPEYERYRSRVRRWI